MATLGQKPATQHVSLQKQTITGNGGTSYSLQQSVGSALDVAVFINNTRQEPTVAYSASGTTLTMTGAVNSSDHFYVIFLGKAIATTGLPVDAVGTANINANAVTGAKIANNTIDVTSKLTGVIPTANGGTGFSSRPAFDIELFKTTSNAEGVNGVIQFNGITTNQGSHWNSTSHRFEVPNTGMYQFNFNGTGTRTTGNGVMTSASPCQVVLQKSTDSGGSYNMVNSGVYSYFNANTTTYGGYMPIAFSCVLTLNSGDYVQFKVQSGYLYNNTKASNLWSAASGYQI